MSNCSRRLAFLAFACLILAGCGSRETKIALKKASELEGQKQYEDANDVLMQALRARETKLRGANSSPADESSADALKKVQSDSEILKMEREQVAIYLRLERSDLASAVYSDILAGNPHDGVVYDILKDTDPKIRTGAVRVLGLESRPEAIDALVSSTKDSDQDVRRSAVASLGSIKDPRVVDPLIASLKDSYWFVRSDAAEALGRQNDAKALRPLMEAVLDPDANVESAAENALVLLCAAPRLPHDEFAARLNDANPKIVLISAVCLALLKDPRATPVLLKYADSTDSDTRLHAIKALGETGDVAAIPLLRQDLKDPDNNVRGWSVIGLGKLKDSGSLPDLQAIAADPSQSPRMRGAAAAAVNTINGAAPAGAGGN